MHVIGQIYIIDSFVGGEFTTYGLDVLNYTEMDHEDRPDPMHVVFPKMAKCTFFKYGPSGTIQKHDGLCVLPVNIINEKIFIFLWFWLVVVSAVTGIFLIYRVAVLAGPQIRIALITVKVRTHCFEKGHVHLTSALRGKGATVVEIGQRNGRLRHPLYCTRGQGVHNLKILRTTYV